MKDTGGKWWGHTGRELSLWTRGREVWSRCAGARPARDTWAWSRKSRTQVGLAWGLTLGHLTSDLGRAGGADPAPPLKGQLPNSKLSPQCLAQANYRAAAKPGYKRVGEPPRHLGELYARAWGPQLVPGPQETGVGQGPSGTLQFTPSYIISQPFNPTQSIKPTAGGRGGEGNPNGASERKAGALFTQLTWEGPPRPEGAAAASGTQATFTPHTCSPHFCTLSGMCVPQTSKPHSHPSPASGTHRNVTPAHILSGGARGHPKPHWHPGRHGMRIHLRAGIQQTPAQTMLTAPRKQTAFHARKGSRQTEGQSLESRNGWGGRGKGVRRAVPHPTHLETYRSCQQPHGTRKQLLGPQGRTQTRPLTQRARAPHSSHDTETWALPARRLLETIHQLPPGPCAPLPAPHPHMLVKEVQ